jgi:hypothetical protein
LGCVISNLYLIFSAIKLAIFPYKLAPLMELMAISSFEVAKGKKES